MSQRHRIAEAPLPPKEELRAQAHSERHRIHAELNQVAKVVSTGIDPHDVHEPGAAWKPMHHHDSEVAKAKLVKIGRRTRHWKTKMWKRRTALRQAKADALKAVHKD
jgi:hypothetical protein